VLPKAPIGGADTVKFYGDVGCEADSASRRVGGFDTSPLMRTAACRAGGASKFLAAGVGAGLRLSGLDQRGERFDLVDEACESFALGVGIGENWRCREECRQNDDGCAPQVSH
jgi:hypothetical protein